MSLINNDELLEYLKLRKKLLGLGICSNSIKGDKGDPGIQGPTGPKGDKGDTGPSAIASVQGMFFTGFLDANTSGELTFDNPWFLPNTSPYFSLNGNNGIDIVPGVYEITFSGLIEQVDNSHGALFYLKDDTGAAIKDLYFKLEAGNIRQMAFSKTILFRFENDTTLQGIATILGDDPSNIVISNVNLLIKKIQE